MMRAFFKFVCMTTLPLLARAAAPETQMIPMATSRVIKNFDFEETALGNFDQIPMFWNKVVGKGYPLYTAGKFDNTVFRSKSTSFKLQLDGGSVAYQYTPGKLAAGAGSDYFIVGFVKTTALPFARAQLTAWFADAAGKFIPGTQASSAAWASADGKDDWHVLQIYMPGQKNNVHSIVLQMSLLQPQQISNRQLGKFELYSQDLKGAAWFDDISVMQLPRITISTPAPANVLSPDQPIQLDMSLSDLGKDHLGAKVTITDSAGNPVSTENYSVQPRPDAPWNQSFKVQNHLPEGSYTAQFDVQQDGAVVAHRQVKFLVAQPAPLGFHPAQDFGLIASDWPPEAWPQLPTIAQYAGVGLIKLPAWRKDMSDDALLRRDPPFENFVTDLERAGVTPIAAFSELPAALGQKINDKGDSVIGLLDADPLLWRPYLSFVLVRYANRVKFWEIGQTPDAFYSPDPLYRRVYANVQREIGGLLNHPKLIIPWNVLYDFDARDYPDAMLELRIPSTVKAAEIPTDINNYTQNKVDVLAVIEPPDAGAARAQRIADFAQRIILARFSRPVAVLIDVPINHQSTLAGMSFEPSELLLTFRNIVQNLSGKTPLRELTPEPGVHGYLFDDNGDDILALWSDSDSPQTVSLALGKNPVLVDLFGRKTPLTPVDSISAVTVGATPIFIDHVDGRLVQVRASFALAAANIPAGSGVSQTTVHLENPYNEPMVGKLVIKAPKGWEIDSPTISVNLAPGEKIDAPITLHFPYSEFAGTKTIRGKLSTNGGERQLDVSTQVTVNSGTVEMECSAQTLPTGELVLQQTVTNVSSVPVSAQAYAMIPGAARQERYILNLQPGAKTIKRFIFTDAKPEPGQTGVLGLRQNDGRVLLTKSVPLP